MVHYRGFRSDRISHTGNDRRGSCQYEDMASFVRFALSQLGVKPEAKQSLTRLLDAPDLEANAPIEVAASPQRWRRSDQRTWRTGAVPNPQPWQAAARAVGSVTAWRSLRGGPKPQWLWLQWTPLASTADAHAALAAVGDPAFGLRNLRAKVESTGKTIIDPAPAINGADRVTAIQEHNSGPGPVFTLHCAAGRHLLVLCASGEGWTLPALVTLAELQLSQLPET